MNRLIPYSGEVYDYLLYDYAGRYAAVEIGACAAIIACLIAGRWGNRTTARLGAVAFASAWAWIGIVFYWQTYQSLNWAGTYFGWAALLQAGLLAGWGITTGAFRADLSIHSLGRVTGLVTLAIAALAGQLSRLIAGGEVSAIQAVGVTPLATTTATLGLMLLNRTPVPVWLLPIPISLLAWDAVRACVLIVPQDIVLLVAAGFAAICLIGRFRAAEQS